MAIIDRRLAAARGAPLSALVDPAWSPELYRQLYVSLRLPQDSATQVIGVTSAISGEGRTTIAMGLARTLAGDLQLPVWLVEVDLEHPALAERLDVPAAPGLAEVLRGDRELAEVAHVREPNLFVVTAGASGPDRIRLLRQLPVRDPFRGAAGVDGVVILDLPPIINQSYSSLVARVADAIVLVVRAGVTPVSLVRTAVARLEDRPPQGVVLNGPRSALPAWWPDRDV